eukprot:3602101-Alexandrium_andersonii.AAC.1
MDLTPAKYSTAWTVRGPPLAKLSPRMPMVKNTCEIFMEGRAISRAPVTDDANPCALEEGLRAGERLLAELDESDDGIACLGWPRHAHTQTHTLI